MCVGYRYPVLRQRFGAQSQFEAEIVYSVLSVGERHRSAVYKIDSVRAEGVFHEIAGIVFGNAHGRISVGDCVRLQLITAVGAVISIQHVHSFFERRYDRYWIDADAEALYVQRIILKRRLRYRNVQVIRAERVCTRAERNSVVFQLFQRGLMLSAFLYTEHIRALAVYEARIRERIRRFRRHSRIIRFDIVRAYGRNVHIEFFRHYDDGYRGIAEIQNIVFKHIIFIVREQYVYGIIPRGQRNGSGRRQRIVRGFEFSRFGESAGSIVPHYRRKRHPVSVQFSVNAIGAFVQHESRIREVLPKPVHSQRIAVIFLYVTCARNGIGKPERGFLDHQTARLDCNIIVLRSGGG